MLPACILMFEGVPPYPEVLHQNMITAFWYFLRSSSSPLQRSCWWNSSTSNNMMVYIIGGDLPGCGGLPSNTRTHTSQRPFCDCRLVKSHHITLSQLYTILAIACNLMVDGKPPEVPWRSVFCYLKRPHLNLHAVRGLFTLNSNYSLGWWNQILAAYRLELIESAYPDSVDLHQWSAT